MKDGEKEEGVKDRTQNDILRAEDKILHFGEKEDKIKQEIICPYCREVFFIDSPS